MGTRITIVENSNTTVVEFIEPIDVHGLLITLGRFPDGHIVIRDGIPIPLTEHLSDGDRVRIIRVASGG